ncbi:DUF6924 domain-containing protein [Streptomyces sp. NPDC001514]
MNPLVIRTDFTDEHAWDRVVEDLRVATRFRLLPDAAVEISTNLGLGNMDFEDFEDFAGDGPYERSA